MNNHMQRGQSFLLAVECELIKVKEMMDYKHHHLTSQEVAKDAKTSG